MSELVSLWLKEVKNHKDLKLALHDKLGLFICNFCKKLLNCLNILTLIFILYLHSGVKAWI